MKWSELLTKDQWSLKECIAQGVHFVVGAVLTYLVWPISFFKVPAIPIIFTVCVAIMIEVEQKIRIRENGKSESWKIPDRVRDIFFYFLGSLTLLLYT